MPESLDAYAELRAMRARLEGIEHRQEMLVRAHADEILATVWEYIDADETLAEIYLLVDGKRTQKEIVAALDRKGITLDQSNVSRKLKKLMNDLGLVEVADRDASGATLRKSDLDKILHLTPKVERRLAAIQKAKGTKSQSRSSKP
jgi:DNA-binding transcriptional ArsR family regulator